MDLSFTKPCCYMYTNQIQRQTRQLQLVKYIETYPLSSLCYMNQDVIRKRDYMYALDYVLDQNGLKKVWDKNLTEQIWLFTKNVDFVFKQCTRICRHVSPKNVYLMDCQSDNNYFTGVFPCMNNDLYIIDLNIHHVERDFENKKDLPSTYYEIQIDSTSDYQNICSITNDGDLKVGRYEVGCLRKIQEFETIRCIVDMINQEISFILFNNPVRMITLPIPEIDVELQLCIWHNCQSLSMNIV